MAYTVLVVDDHPPTVQLIKSALDAQSLQVRTAENGAEALLAIHDEVPDLIILDVIMPILDGFQTLHVLQQSDQLKDIPVIMLTARASDRDVAHGWRWGITSYVTKPFSIENLLALVQRIRDSSPQAAARDAKPE